MSAFATLLASLSAALMAAPALAGGHISSNRLRPIPSGQATAIVLRLAHAEATEFVLGCLDWKSSIVVECYARAVSGSDPVAAADALLVDVWQRLAALNTGALGADISFSPNIDWQYDDGEATMVCAALQLLAQHRTATTNLQPI